MIKRILPFALALTLCAPASIPPAAAAGLRTPKTSTPKLSTSGSSTSGSSTSGSSNSGPSAEDLKKAEEAAILSDCTTMDGKIGTTEDQKEAIMDYARKLGGEDGRVQGAWETLVDVTGNIEGANAATDQARQFVDPYANLNNAGYLVQTSRKEMFPVAVELGMNTFQLFGFVPPANWNGVMPGEKAISGLDPRGVMPGGQAPATGGFGGLDMGSVGSKISGNANVGMLPGQQGGGGGGFAEKTSGLTTGAGSGVSLESAGGAAPLRMPELSGSFSKHTGGGLSNRPQGEGEEFSAGIEESPSQKTKRHKGVDTPDGGPILVGDRDRSGIGEAAFGRSGKLSRRAAEAWELNLAGKYQDAERAAREAIRLDPNDHNAYEALAWAELRQGKYKDAERDASRAIALDGKSARAYRIRAFARQMIGDRAGMLADIEMAAMLDPEYAEEAARARRGGDIYDPSKGDEELLLGHRRHSGKGIILLVVLLAAAAAAFWTALRLAKRKIGRKSVAGLADELRVGGTRAFDSYEIGQELGRSIRGTVVAAKDKVLGRQLVIRKMRVADPQERKALLEAARKAAALTHPSSARMYDVVEDGDAVCMSCEFVAGRTLRDLVRKDPAGSFERRARALRPVCQLISAAHAVGLTHGRLHLGNIFLSESGEVRVADLGTVGGMDPERDIEALGQCLEELSRRSQGPVPDHLRLLIERCSHRTQPPVAGVEEFLRILSGK